MAHEVDTEEERTEARRARELAEAQAHTQRQIRRQRHAFAAEMRQEGQHQIQRARGRRRGRYAAAAESRRTRQSATVYASRYDGAGAGARAADAPDEEKEEKEEDWEEGLTPEEIAAVANARAPGEQLPAGASQGLLTTRAQDWAAEYEAGVDDQFGDSEQKLTRKEAREETMAWLRDEEERKQQRRRDEAERVAAARREQEWFREQEAIRQDLLSRKAGEDNAP